MKSKFFVRLVLWLVLATFLPPGLSSRTWQEEASALDRYIATARQQWRIPGMAVAVVKDGKILLARGYGIRKQGESGPVDADTLFAIASNTKAFTAAALSMLTDEKRLQWSDPVQQHLPGFQLTDPWISAEIRVRDLLCHRSGLGTFSGDLLWYGTGYSGAEIVRRCRFLKSAFPFRSGYGYSNLMFIAAGEVIQAVSGQPWGQFLQQRIFTPLGMVRTNSSHAELLKDANIAWPHYVFPDGRVVIHDLISVDNAGAAAAINSSVADMSRWLRMLLNKGVWEGRKILSPDALEEMWAVQNPTRPSRRTRELFPSTHFSGYGLGWGLMDYRGSKVVSHSGALDGMISQVMLVPEKNLGLVVLTNSINSLPRALMFRVLDSFSGTAEKDWSAIFLKRSEEEFKSFMARVDWINEKNRQPSGLTAAQLEEFAGLYECPLYGQARVTVSGKGLKLNLIPAPMFQADLTPLSPDVFMIRFDRFFSFIPHGIGVVQFSRDPRGKIVNLKIDVPNDDFDFGELNFSRVKEPDNKP